MNSTSPFHLLSGRLSDFTSTQSQTVNSELLGFIGFVTESAKVSDLSATPPSARRRNNAGGRLNAQTQPHFCTSSRTTQSSAVSRNDPPFKTLGLKLQNNTTMTTSVRSRNSNCPHLFAACAQSAASQDFTSLLLVFPKPCHIHLRSLAPPHAYLQSLAAIISTNLPKLAVPQGISKCHAQELGTSENPS